MMFIIDQEQASVISNLGELLLAQIYRRVDRSAQLFCFILVNCLKRELFMVKLTRWSRCEIADENLICSLNSGKSKIFY